MTEADEYLFYIISMDKQGRLKEAAREAAKQITNKSK